LSTDVKKLSIFTKTVPTPGQERLNPSEYFKLTAHPASKSPATNS
jgi:hypothetical protein